MWWKYRVMFTLKVAVIIVVVFVSKQFSVPGNNIVLSPELYITVLAYTSILNPEASQVNLLTCILYILLIVHVVHDFFYSPVKNSFVIKAEYKMRLITKFEGTLSCIIQVVHVRSWNKIMKDTQYIVCASAVCVFMELCKRENKYEQNHSFHCTTQGPISNQSWVFSITGKELLSTSF